MRKKKNELSPKLTKKTKLAKRIMTVNDLLTNDDVTEILGDINEVKPHISDMIIIYMDRRDGQYYVQVTRETTIPLAIWMLEATKFDLLYNDGGE